MKMILLVVRLIDHDGDEIFDGDDCHNDTKLVKAMKHMKVMQLMIAMMPICGIDVWDGDEVH